MTMECHGCLLWLTALWSKSKGIGIRIYSLPARSKFKVPTNALMTAVSRHVSELLCLVIKGCSDDEANVYPTFVLLYCNCPHQDR